MFPANPLQENNILVASSVFMTPIKLSSQGVKQLSNEETYSFSADHANKSHDDH